MNVFLVNYSNMNVNRRNFLIFLGAAAGSLASDAWNNKVNSNVLAETAAPSLTETEGLSFEAVKLALPDSASQLSVEQQIASYKAYEVQDDLILPTGFTYDLIAAWGDRTLKSVRLVVPPTSNILVAAPSE